MLRKVVRKLGDALILGLLVIVVLVATACGGWADTASPEPATMPTEESGSDGVSSENSQADVTLHLRRARDNDIRFEHISLEQGLSQSVVLCILQDSKGFMWFGTQDGLNRYDGYEFTVYKHDPENPNSLSDNFIQSLYEDQSGALWIGTNGGGLDRFDRETEQFIHYQHDPNDPHSLSNNQIWSVYQDQAGVLWIGTFGGGLNRFDRETEQFIHYQNDPDDPHSLSNDIVLPIYEDREGMLWIGTYGGGLDRFDRETEQFIHYQNDPDDPHSLSDNAVCSIYEDRAGVLWIGTQDGGLNRFDRDTEQFIHYQNDPNDPHSLSNNDVHSIYQDREGVLWLGTVGGGLDRLVLSDAEGFDRDTAQFIHYQNDLNDPHSLSDNTVYSIYQDQAGVLWIGTFGGGLNKFDRSTERFARYQTDPNDPHSLSDSTVWSIYQDQAGVLWIGTNGGLNRLVLSDAEGFDRETEQFIHYQNDPNDPYSLSDDQVWAIYQDREGVLWVGTGAGLDRLVLSDVEGFEREPEQFIHYPTDNSVFSIHQDPEEEGVFWIGTWGGGLGKFDRETGQFTYYQNIPTDAHSLSHNTVGSIYQDREGVLWIGTHGGGLDRFDRETEQSIHYQNDPNDPYSLSHNLVLSIYQDQEGVLWIGTLGGLDKLDGETETFTHYREKDGLPNDVVYGILEDDHGNLWLSTNRGLSRFDPQTETFTNYDVGDGLQSNEFNQGAYYRSSSGEMFFGGINGFNAFYPDRIKENFYVPPVVLTSLTQGGEEIDLGKAVESVTEVTFSWPNNFFGFEFAALSYTQPEENQYAYMLEGFEEDWNYLGTRRFGRYTNLPGGTYILRMKGSNSDGIWNEEGVSMTITIVPPFWETWWFRGVIALLLVGSVLGGYRLRVRSIEARSREFENQVANRTQELAALNAIAATVSQSLDLDEILNDALDKTLEVMEIEAGGIYLLDEEARVLTVAAQRGFSSQFVAEIDRLKVGEGFSGRVAQSGQPLVIRNVSTDPRLTRMVVREEGLRSLAGVPLNSKGKVLGTLFAVRHDYREFTDQDVQLLTSIGHQIGVAVENARLFETEQRRAEQFRLIGEVGRHIISILDVNQLLGEIVRRVSEILGYYLVGIGLIEEDEVVMKTGVGPYWEIHGHEPLRLKVGQEGIIGWVAGTGESLLASDVTQEPRYHGVPQITETRSELAVPLRTKDKVIGVLDIQSRRLDAFDESDVVVLQSLAHQAAVAIQNAQLYEQARQLAVVEERQRLARELHDSVTQALYGVRLYSEAAAGQLSLGHADRAAEHLRELQDTAQEALAEMRLLIYELRPAVLEEEGLVAALQARLLAVEGRAGLKTEFKVEGDGRLPPEIEEGLYRIGQEALNNALKHAHARNITVCLRQDERTVTLEIADDGIGFDPTTARERGGLGLSAMEERTAELGGRLIVQSGPREGTRVLVEVSA